MRVNSLATEMAGERRESDFMNRSLDEIAAEMDSSLYEREERDGHHRPQHRFSPYPADHVPSWRTEKEGANGSGAGAPAVGDGNRVFVANLNYTVTWQKVKDLLKTVGPVLKCDLFKNADGSSRGMGLVLFADRESADKAVQELNGTELDGRKIFLRKDMRVEDREKAGMPPANPKPRPPSNPAATIFVANLDYSLTWQKLRDIFRVAGKIMHVEMLTDPDGRPKGCASIQFESTSEAMNSIILFHGQLLQNRPMVVRMDAKSPIQADPIQLKLQVGKGGGAGNVRSGGGGGVGLFPNHPPPLMGGGGAPAGVAGNIPLSPTLTQALSSSSLSSSLSGQLPLLAALGLSALSNLRHFSPEQLSLLGVSPGHLSGGGNGGGGGGGKTMGGRASSGFLGHRSLPPLPEYGQEGLLSQHPFNDSPGGLIERERSLHSLSGALPFRHPPQNSSYYSASMATDLSLATALAAPHPSSLFYSRAEPLAEGIGGRKGKKLFVRNLNFGTTWQALKDYMKTAGPISYVDVLKNEDGRSRGCAAVVFDSEHDAEHAIRMFDQSELDARRISVTFDRAN